MRKTTLLIIALFVCGTGSICPETQAAQMSTSGSSASITLEINYNNQSPSIEKQIPWHPNMTALDALKTSALVTTERKGGFLLVTAIDGIAGKRGESAWYYSVNGESADVMPDDQIINQNDRIIWTFRRDVCTPEG